MSVDIATVTLIVLTIVFTANMAIALGWMLSTWWNDENYQNSTFPTDSEAHPKKISLLLAARHETEVLAGTVASLCASQYENFEIVIIIGHDDPETEVVARQAAKNSNGKAFVVIDHSLPKSKPSALNTGLKACSGEIVGVFDAEDEVSPNLLNTINHTFEDPSVDVVQGGVQLINHRSTWFSLRNCLEYYLWFRSRLQWQAKKGFIPLGGNTVFIKRDSLLQVEGWNPDFLTEDCDLGIRLGVLGAKVAVGYDPSLSTLEETPLSINSFIKQRTRWSQGFLQIYKKGDWRSLPSKPQRLLAWYTLLFPLFQAFSGIFMPLSIAFIFFLKIGENIALFLFLPLLITILTAAMEALALREFGIDFNVKVTLRDYGRIFWTLFPYQILLSWSGVRATLREFKGEVSWEKTSHVGAHRFPVDTVQPQVNET